MRHATPSSLVPAAAPAAPRIPAQRAFAVVALSMLLLLTVLVSGCGGHAGPGSKPQAAADAADPASLGRAVRLGLTGYAGEFAAPLLLQPLAGQSIRQSATPFRWSPVAGAQAYYLWVGTSPGAKDVVDSGEMAPTHLALDTTTLLPRDTALYARLYRLIDGRWSYDVDVPFTAVADPGDLLYPRAGMVLSEASLGLPFRWQEVPTASAYYLYVGTQPGLHDVVNSSEMPATMTTRDMLRGMPLNTALYARLHVLDNGIWRAGRDVPFRVVPDAAVLSSPANRALIISNTLALNWQGVPQASAYRVDLGSTVGGSELGSSGPLEVDATAFTFTGPLPQGQPLFVRLHTLIGQEWRQDRDREVTLAPRLPAPSMLHPSPNQGSIDTAAPMRWSAVPGAQAYRLLIGATPGGSEWHDSGPIATTLRFVPGLPVARPLHGTLQVQINGTWLSQRFVFAVVADEASEALALDAVVVALRQARGMASESHDTRPGSLLEAIGGGATTNCTGYAAALVTLLRHLNLALPVRIRSVCLFAGGTECHTVVEVQTPSSGQWSVFDPTFVTSPIDRHSRQRLSTAQMSQRVRAAGFDTIDYEAHDGLARSRLDGYYIDYALLFAQPAETLGDESWPTHSVIEHFTPQGATVEHKQGTYALRCGAAQSHAVALIDGTERKLACQGMDRLSSMFKAAAVEMKDAPGAGATLQQPRRYTLQ